MPGPAPIYDTIGRGYVAHRRPEPSWEAALAEYLGDGRLVVNVGAGTGSYEAVGRDMLAIEPSGVMVAQRPAGAAPAVRASASALPLESDGADVALAILTCPTRTPRVHSAPASTPTASTTAATC